MFFPSLPPVLSKSTSLVCCLHSPTIHRILFMWIAFYLQAIFQKWLSEKLICYSLQFLNISTLFPLLLSSIFLPFGKCFISSRYHSWNGTSQWHGWLSSPFISSACLFPLCKIFNQHNWRYIYYNSYLVTQHHLTDIREIIWTYTSCQSRC